MNNALKIIEILTKSGLDEEFLKMQLLENKLEHFDVKLAVLFRRYYGIYNLTTEEEVINPKEMIAKIVKYKRNLRFSADRYWSIWKEEGYFFGFVEGFFHAQEGKNQLCKIRGRSLEEDFLLPLPRKKEMLKKYGNINQIEYFKNPETFVFRFKALEEFRVFLRVNKIERMVGRKEGMIKGMHFNIYTAICEIAKDEYLKELFKNGVINKETEQIDTKFFDSKTPLTKQGLFAVLSSFKGYGAKISKMVMNLVFDVKIVAVDRRVLKSAIILNLVELNAVYLDKISKKFAVEKENTKEMADKISTLSEKYALTKTESVLNENLTQSPFLSEADFLLFMYNGGDSWNFKEKTETEEICKVGKCCFDETGVCKLRKKVEYKEFSSEEPSKISVLRNVI